MSNLREGVVLLFAHEGKVLVGNRAWPGQHGWQLPQGGRDPGEDLWATVVREAKEELGLDPGEFKLVMRLPHQTSYLFPEDRKRDGYDGHLHTWFLLQLEDPKRTFEPSEEFSAYKWVQPETAYREVVGFKKQAYAEALNAFGLLMHVSGRHFWLSPDDVRKVADWRQQQAQPPLSAVGGVVTFSFTPTNLGTVLKVKNWDGEELDLTDYEGW